MARIVVTGEARGKVTARVIALAHRVAAAVGSLVAGASPRSVAWGVWAAAVFFSPLAAASTQYSAGTTRFALSEAWIRKL